jgi:hypothetical protein
MSQVAGSATAPAPNATEVMSVPVMGATADQDPLLNINAGTGDFTTPGTVVISNPGAFQPSEGTCTDTGCDLFFASCPVRRA